MTEIKVTDFHITNLHRIWDREEVCVRGIADMVLRLRRSGHP